MRRHITSQCRGAIPRVYSAMVIFIGDQTASQNDPHPEELLNLGSMSPYMKAKIISQMQKLVPRDTIEIHQHLLRSGTIIGHCLDDVRRLMKDVAIEDNPTKEDLIVATARLIIGDVSIPDLRFMWRLNGTDTIGMVVGLKIRLRYLAEIKDGVLGILNKSMNAIIDSLENAPNASDIRETIFSVCPLVDIRHHFLTDIDTDNVWDRIVPYLPTMNVDCV